jgi:hypothetical protein
MEVRSKCPPADLERTVELDIENFNSWFRSLGNEPLVRSEFAILKTYLFWKVKGSDEKTSR